MKKPTVAVSAEDFEKLAYCGLNQLTLCGKRYARIVPDSGQEISEDEMMFAGNPATITFRKRWSMKKVTRRVHYIIVDRSERYNLKFKIIMK